MLFEQDSWRTAMQDVAAAIDAEMGELVEVTPIDSAATKPNFPAVMKPDKAVTVVAVYTANTIQVGGPSDRRPRGIEFGLSVGVTAGKSAFSFAYGVLPFPLRQGSRIKRLCSGEMFEITDVKPDYVSRTVCDVTRLGREPEQS